MTSTTLNFSPAQLRPSAATGHLKKLLAKLVAARDADARRTVARYIARTLSLGVVSEAQRRARRANSRGG